LAVCAGESLRVRGLGLTISVAFILSVAPRAGCANLDDILNQIGSDLETKKEPAPARSEANLSESQPAQDVLSKPPATTGSWGGYVASIRTRAEEGDPDSQGIASYLIQVDSGSVGTSGDALNYAVLSSGKRSPYGQFALGRLCEKGLGVEQNSEKAAALYKNAFPGMGRLANSGSAMAQAIYGVMYETGRGTGKNDMEAVRWYRKSSEQGNAIGQKNLGWMYANGLGVAKNLVESVKWYRRSAEQGSASGQKKLAWAYESGSGVEKSLSEAVRWYRRSAEQGNAEAQFYIGSSYAHGEGVEKNESEAVKWYRRAAEQGNEDAISALNNY